jgi:hypothetical protein
LENRKNKSKTNRPNPPWRSCTVCTWPTAWPSLAPAYVACARPTAWPSLALACPAFWPSGVHGSCVSTSDGAAASAARRRGERCKGREHGRGLTGAEKGDTAELANVDGDNLHTGRRRRSERCRKERARRPTAW